MQPRKEAPTGPRARRGVRRRGPAALAAGLALASLGAAALAPGGSAAEGVAVEASSPASMLGVGTAGTFGGMLEPSDGNPRRALPESARGRAAFGGPIDERLRPSRQTSRGHGFVRDARGFATIDVPGASYTAASGSNSGGQIVGDYLDSRKRFHGFIRDGRRVRRIDFPGAKGTFAAGINDPGRVLGYVL
jgi:hypothetical protein